MAESYSNAASKPDSLKNASNQRQRRRPIKINPCPVNLDLSQSVGKGAKGSNVCDENRVLAI